MTEDHFPQGFRGRDSIAHIVFLCAIDEIDGIGREEVDVADDDVVPCRGHMPFIAWTHAWAAADGQCRIIDLGLFVS